MMNSTMRHITLSPALRTRLRVAMEHVCAEIDGPIFDTELQNAPHLFDREHTHFINACHHQRILDGYSAALLPTSETDYARFGLTPPTPQEQHECTEFADALIEMASAQGAPCIALHGLPTESELHNLALAGLTASIHTGRKDLQHPENHEIQEPLTSIQLSFEGTILKEHAKQELHADFVRLMQTPCIRILSSDVVGNNPLTTVAASGEELIDEIVENLVEAPNERFREVIEPFADQNAVKEAVITALTSPIWSPVSLASEYKTKPASRAVLFYNPHYTINGHAPQYGLYHFQPSQEASRRDDAHRLNLKDEFIEAVTIAFKQSLESLKTRASSMLLEPGTALIFNDHFVVHGTGNFVNYPYTEPLSERRVHTTIARGGYVEPDDAYIPGAASLTCAAHRGHIEAPHTPQHEKERQIS